MEPKLFKAALYGSNDDDSSTSSIMNTARRNLVENINWDVQQKTKYQENSILHVAAKSGNKKTTEKILQKEHSLVLQQNKKQDTPLHIAARLGHADLSSFLISRTNTYAKDCELGINKYPFRQVNSLLNTALHEAVRNGHHSIVKLLIEQDQNLTSLTNEAGESPLFLAIDRKFHTIALCILETCPGNIQETCLDSSFLQGRNGMNAMHAAVIGMPPQRNKFVEKLDTFLTDYFRRHSNVKALFERYTGVTCAITRQGDVLREVLVRCGSEILKKKDDFGWLPLHYAAHVGNVQVVKLFLTNNIDLAYGKIGDKEGMSALHIAARKGLKEHIGVIRTLVEECPDVCELVDNRGRTALHVAVESGNRYAVKTLLNMPEFNDLINEQDKDGNTSLHLAAFDVTHHAVLIMLATDGRMEKTILNEMGMTAIDIISTNTQLSKLDKAFMISMLEEKGYRPSLERRIIVRETKSVDHESIEGHEKSQQTTQRLKMPAKDEVVASGSGSSNTARENNKEKHHVTPNNDTGNDKPYHHIRNIGGINLLVATIIASITFAAAMQIPGGLDDKGIAKFEMNSVFKIFVIADTLAFGCAASSMFIHFAVALSSQILQETYSYPINCVVFLTILSIASTVVAFIMGTELVFARPYPGAFEADLPMFVASLSFLIPIFYFLFRFIKIGYRLLPSVYITVYNLGMAIEKALDEVHFFQIPDHAFVFFPTVLLIQAFDFFRILLGLVFRIIFRIAFSP
ncbi:hypothetical protein FNV43_RR16422 [Rhamnella rubrinervis]|uniref:PGG domain-containing protein n=1 Tax=Rhamnella rubrinervis TaxID=2594499 RepID=A0A8K0MD60_9ROSA|nr:hypothetical protein FNV43_RR16422 [Rhamnella rubrinervis]